MRVVICCSCRKGIHPDDATSEWDEFMMKKYYWCYMCYYGGNYNGGNYYYG